MTIASWVFPQWELSAQWSHDRKMDNRELNLVVPEARTQRQTNGDGLNPEEDDASQVPLLTVEYVTYNEA